ncbi:MAG: hypothetical protein AAF460_12405 [Pseudomonadota bacterium]
MAGQSPGPSPPRGRLDYTLLAIALGVLLFNSPLFEWWTTVKPPWFLPYLLWGVLILAIALCQFGTRRDD